MFLEMECRYHSTVSKITKCDECEDKRNECEKRSARWILTLCFFDEQLRFTINTLDHHRRRNRKIVYVEELREKLKWILDQAQQK